MYVESLLYLTIICSSLAYLITDEFSDNEDEDPADMSKDAATWDYGDTIFKLAGAEPDCDQKLVQRDSESIQLDSVVLDDLEYISDRKSYFSNADDETFINQGGSNNAYTEALNEGPGSDNACPIRDKGNYRQPVLQNLQHTDSHKPPLGLCPSGQFTLCCDRATSTPNHPKRDTGDPRHPLWMSQREVPEVKTNFKDCVNCKFSPTCLKVALC